MRSVPSCHKIVYDGAHALTWACSYLGWACGRLCVQAHCSYVHEGTPRLDILSFQALASLRISLHVSVSVSVSVRQYLSLICIELCQSLLALSACLPLPLPLPVSSCLSSCFYVGLCLSVCAVVFLLPLSLCVSLDIYDSRRVTSTAVDAQYP